MATQKLVFLGIMLDGRLRTLSLPLDKKEKAKYMLELCIKNKKATVKQIQSLTGLLNFLNRVIVPGRAFTRRLYFAIHSQTGALKQHHHVSLSRDFREDC